MHRIVSRTGEHQLKEARHLLMTAWTWQAWICRKQEKTATQGATNDCNFQHFDEQESRCCWHSSESILLICTTLVFVYDLYFTLILRNMLQAPKVRVERASHKSNALSNWNESHLCFDIWFKIAPFPTWLYNILPMHGWPYVLAGCISACCRSALYVFTNLSIL